MRYDNERFALESKSGGKNTLLFDDRGKPSVMVRIPRFRICDVLGGTDTSTHPAFIVNGKTIDCFYVSKYINVVLEDRAYSLAGVEPTTIISKYEAKECCEAKGPGWHLMSNAEWSAIALWSKMNSTMPRGNNCSGADHANRWETAVKSPTHEWEYATNWNNMAHYQREDGMYILTGKTLTGTGPATWSHDWSTDGVYDLNGNTWEHISGLHLINGEIQVIPDNDSAMGIDESLGSSNWRAINQAGEYVTPGIANTLKLNGVNAGSNEGVNAGKGAMQLDIVRDKPAYTGGEVDDHWEYYSNTFESLKAASGVTVPTIAKALTLFPNDDESHGQDTIYARNYGNRTALRGGYWAYTTYAGVFFLYFSVPPSWGDAPGSFRSAFVPL